MLNAETKRHIDNARDILVGVVPNPTAQIDQITNALIYKFMDDMDQAAIKVGAQPSFFIKNLEQYAWSRLMSDRLGNQERMNLYAEALTKFANASQLPQLFRDIFKSSFLPYRSPEVLSLFLKEINYFDYAHPEELGNAYEYLLQIMGSQGDAGQFRTPRHIIDFVVDVVNPTKDDKVLDPACGTAGFLISAYKHILEQHDGKNDPEKKEKPLTPEERKKLFANFEGHDIDPSMVRIAQVNMYLHQFKNPKVGQYDTLSQEERWGDRYDVILANPPFMSPRGGIRPHNKFSIQSTRSEVLFLDYIVNHLQPKGRAGIIVPDGIITRSGKQYAQLRKSLISSGLWAVIDLPAGIFQPYSKVKTSILFIDSRIEVSKVFFSRLEPLTQPTSYEVDHSIELNFHSLREELRLIERKFNSNESKDTQHPGVLSKNTILDSKEAYLRFEYYDRTANGSDPWGMVPLGEIIEKSGEKVGSRKNVQLMSITMREGLIDQDKKFKKRIASVDISNYKLVKRNELVVGFPIDEGVLGFQTKYDFAAVSPAYDVWKIKREDIPVTYLESILRSSPAIAKFKSAMKGTANRRRVVPKDEFLKIRIPMMNLETVTKITKMIETKQMENRKYLQIIEENNASIKKIVDESWN